MLVLTGLFVGVLFGFILQRGRFCMNSAFRDIITMKDYTLLKSVGIALLVMMAGFAIMNMNDVIALNPKPLWWGANLLGSFVFGIGMVLAGGCASGITYRVGEGMVGAMTAVLGLAVGAYLTAVDGTFAKFLFKFKTDLQTNTKIMNGESQYTLPNLLGIDHEVLALGIVIVAAVVWFFVARKNKEDEGGPWGWLPTGFLIGMVGILAFPLSAAAGRNYPLGITGGWVSVVKKVLNPAEASLDWLGWLVIGVVLGALFASLFSKEFKFRAPSVGTLAKTFGGGLLMGFGAVMSGGCNVGHILSGVPQLSLGSMLAGISIIGGAWLTAYLMFVRPQNK